jgi:hypothetical protein
MNFPTPASDVESGATRLPHFSKASRFLRSIAVTAVLAPLSLVACAFEYSDDAALRASFIVAGMEGIAAGLALAILARGAVLLLRRFAPRAPRLAPPGDRAGAGSMCRA